MGESAPGEQRNQDVMTFQEFIALKDRELKQRIWAPQPYETSRRYGIEDYRDELNRRVAERQTRWLIGLTIGLFLLTLVIAVLTAVLIAIQFGWLRPITTH